MWRNASSGGVEAYLSNLNRHLLERNKMRILQMYLAQEGEPIEVEIEQIGRGELIWIPSFLKNTAQVQLTKAQKFWTKLRRRLFSDFLVRHEILLKTLESYRIDLAAFHWISEDSITVLRYLKRREIPFVVINHFHNARLKRRIAKKYISKASGIGGVSDADVPLVVKTKFLNLSDGIDTDFFQLDKASPLERKIEGALILLPSRITEEKGHLDAVRALALLARKGVRATMAFVGRVGNLPLITNLRQVISEEGLQDHVFFAGELSPEDLRNCYASSDVVVLPSYYEGLGRVLLEAQSMEKPVVAYAVGGVHEVVQHGEGGYLVRKGDIEGLASRLRELLEDHDMRRDMGMRGREFVIERFPLDSLTIRHEEFYTKALNLSGIEQA